jgi:hypothetical protein
VTEQGSLPPRQYSGSPVDQESPARSRPERRGRDRRHGRGGTRGRGKRSRPLLWAGAAAAVVVAAVVVVLLELQGGSSPAGVIPGSLITTFLPGEIQKVPGACASVPVATLGAYLPGKRSVAVPPALDGALDSECDWTVDHPPTYRWLQLTIQAYAPNGLASGDGSATFAAIDAYGQALQQKEHPPASSGAPRAQVATVAGLGTAAFTAAQVYQVGGAVTDFATAVVRYRNVMITVELNGIDHSNRGTYGPVSMNDLTAASLAVARTVFAKVHQ